MDENVALDWFRKAAIQGHARAEDNYGRLLFQTGKRAEAMPYIRKSAARGDPRGQYILGTAYFNGEFVGKDWPRAYALMSHAAASGLAPAATSLAQMDQYIPADQRQKGLALAADMERKDKGAMPAAVEPTDLGPAGAATARSGPRGDYSPVIALAKPTPTKPSPAPRPVPAKAVPAPVKPAAPATPATGGWRIQLGAFSENGRAQMLWAQLSKRISGLSSYSHYLVKGGAITRLQAGPVPTQTDAETLCRAIKTAGTDCLIKKM
jgi:cell division septation protein DedD